MIGTLNPFERFSSEGAHRVWRQIPIAPKVSSFFLSPFFLNAPRRPRIDARPAGDFGVTSVVGLAKDAASLTPRAPPYYLAPELFQVHGGGGAPPGPSDRQGQSVTVRG